MRFAIIDKQYFKLFYLLIFRFLQVFMPKKSWAKGLYLDYCLIVFGLLFVVYI